MRAKKRDRVKRFIKFPCHYSSPLLLRLRLNKSWNHPVQPVPLSVVPRFALIRSTALFNVNLSTELLMYSTSHEFEMSCSQCPISSNKQCPCPESHGPTKALDVLTFLSGADHRKHQSRRVTSVNSPRTTSTLPTVIGIEWRNPNYGGHHWNPSRS